MSLYRGDVLVKLDAEGKPLTTDREVYIRWKVVETGSSYIAPDDTTHQQVVLEKIE